MVFLPYIITSTTKKFGSRGLPILLGAFPKTQRFKFSRRIGSGAMGVVYEAYDRERSTNIALKVLRLPPSGDSVLRFKNEFRTLQDIEHPNLIRLYELMGADGSWFFTMELIDGVNFLEYVRPGIAAGTRDVVQRSTIETAPTVHDDSLLTDPGKYPPTDRAPISHHDECGEVDYTRLRSGLVQLAQGLTALHDAEKIHRDIKPSNILVTPDDRVVLLDFGLATPIDSQSSKHVLGTPNYMSPEQAAQKALGPSADWYSVGAILYQALTSQLPFEGSVLDVMREKQLSPPLPPSAIVPNLPEDLEQLCTNLLRTRSNNRPSGTDVLRRLGGDVASTRNGRRSLASSLFVGRKKELFALQEAYEKTCRGESITIFLRGDSGVGKSELVRNFAEQMAEQALVLSGRCYEQESVPYKAVDGVIDSLSDYLADLPTEQALSCAPEDAHLLLKAFPVLSRVEVLVQSPIAESDFVDVQEMRSRVFAALRELLKRVTISSPIVILIDDLQWADLDSIALLSSITRAPDAPNILLIATIRSNLGYSQDEINLKLQEMHNVLHVPILPLPPEQAAELARQLASKSNGVIDANEIAKEAAGHPLFIAELVRHSTFFGEKNSQIGLDEALTGRIEALPGPTRHVLELLAVAGRPLMRTTVATATKMEFNQLTSIIEFLRSENLARTAGTRRSDTIEPYHDRVREVVVRTATNNIDSYHQRLALALEAAGGSDPETLSSHWLKAGNRTRSFELCIVAADQAANALAFDRAARLYKRALELWINPDGEKWNFLSKLGEALSNAGRGYEAATAFKNAASCAPQQESKTLQSRAAEQLLRSGHIDDGIAAMTPILKANGLTMPRTPGRAVISLLVQRAALKLSRPNLHFRERSESDIPKGTLARLDLCWSAMMGLFTVDQLRGVNFQAYYIRKALAVGEPFRVGCGLAVESTVIAANGGPPDRVEAILERAEKLSNQVHRPYLRGLIVLSRCMNSYLWGRWHDCYSHANVAESIFRDECPGTSLEIESARQIARWSMCYLGSLTQLSSQVEQDLKEATERGNLYAAISARSGFPNIIWLVQDKPERARDEAKKAIDAWSQNGFHLQHMFDLLARAHIELYVGNFDLAFDIVMQKWPAIKKSGLLRIRLNRTLMHELRARTSLALGSAQLHIARESIHILMAENSPWAEGLGTLALGQLQLHEGVHESALATFVRAIRVFEKEGMELHAAATSWKAHMILGDSTKNDFINRALDFFNKHAVVCPARFATMLVPG